MIINTSTSLRFFLPSVIWLLLCNQDYSIITIFSIFYSIHKDDWFVYWIWICFRKLIVIEISSQLDKLSWLICCFMPFIYLSRILTLCLAKTGIYLNAKCINFVIIVIISSLVQWALAEHSVLQIEHSVFDDHTELDLPNNYIIFSLLFT